MKLFKCSTCDKILEEKYVSNHPASKITWLDATEHEERKKKVDELQENSNEDEIKKQEEEKEKRLQAYKAEIKDLDDDKLDDLLESLRAELHELKKKLNPEIDEEAKKSKSAMAEFIGIDNHHSAGVDVDTAVESLTNLQNQRHRNKRSKNSVRSYSVLALKPYESVTHSGDQLFIKLGSTDKPTKGNANDDEFLKSLGSTD